MGTNSGPGNVLSNWVNVSLSAGAFFGRALRPPRDPSDTEEKPLLAADFWSSASAGCENSEPRPKRRETSRNRGGNTGRQQQKVALDGGFRLVTYQYPNFFLGVGEVVVLVSRV